jgi:hypothetical protein
MRNWKTAHVRQRQSWAIGTMGIGLSYRPPGFIGWWNRFLGIDSWGPLKLKNLGSGAKIEGMSRRCGKVKNGEGWSMEIDNNRQRQTETRECI